MRRQAEENDSFICSHVYGAQIAHLRGAAQVDKKKHATGVVLEPLLK